MNPNQTTNDAAATRVEPLLSAEQLTRWEGDRCIANNISFSLRRGEVLGLLGLNGAGKSTTLNMLAGVLTPGSGNVSISGYRVHGTAAESRNARRHLGYLPETPPLYMDMRVGAYLDYCGKLHGLKGKALKQARHTVLEDCQLLDVEKRIIRNLSKGYRQRLGIAQAVIHRPDVILLDEPSSGLDPQQMIGMRKLITQLAQQHAIVFSTHLLSEATAVCNRICVIHDGRVIHQQALQSPDSTITTSTVRLAGTHSAQELMNLPGVINASASGDERWHLDVQTNRHGQLLAAMVDKGWSVTEFGPRRQALEELFTRLVSGADQPLAGNHPTAHSDRMTGSFGNSSSNDQLANDDAPTMLLERESL